MKTNVELVKVDLTAWVLISKLKEEPSSITRSLDFLCTLGMSQSTARKCLFDLVDWGVVIISAAEHDKRAKIVSLTKKYDAISADLLNTKFGDYLKKYANLRQDRYKVLFIN